MIMDDGCLMWLFIRYMLLTQSLNMNMFVDAFVVFSKATRMPYKYALSMLWRAFLQSRGWKDYE